jgi:hypothetical protein
MFSRFLQYIKSHLISTIIGVLGFMSAIVTLFVNVNEQISVKWLIFIIFISLVIIILLIGLLGDILKEKNYINNVEELELKYLNKQTKKGEVFLNLSRIKFTYGDVVRIYYLDDNNIEQFIGIGVISHIQPNQICHIEFLLKNINMNNIKKVFFSLKLNKDEIFTLLSTNKEI